METAAEEEEESHATENRLPRRYKSRLLLIMHIHGTIVKFQSRLDNSSGSGQSRIMFRICDIIFVTLKAHFKEKYAWL